MNDFVRQPQSTVEDIIAPTSNYLTGPYFDGAAAQEFHHHRFVDTRELTLHPVRGMKVRVVS